MAAGAERKLAAIMFTDMVGYSALAQAPMKNIQAAIDVYRVVAEDVAVAHLDVAEVQADAHLDAPLVQPGGRNSGEGAAGHPLRRRAPETRAEADGRPGGVPALLEGAPCSREHLRQRMKDEFVSASFLANVHIGLGQVDEAFTALARAAAEHSYYVGFWKVDPDLDPLRSDPRFVALLGRQVL